MLDGVAVELGVVESVELELVVVDVDGVGVGGGVGAEAGAVASVNAVSCTRKDIDK